MHRAELIIGGISGFAAYPILLSVGVTKTSVMHASLILASAPIFTGLVSFVVTKTWPKALWWVGGGIAMVGVCLLLVIRIDDASGMNAPTVFGNAIVLLSVLFASVGYVFGGWTSARIGQWPATFWSLLVGGVILAPFITSMTLVFDWSAIASLSLFAMLFLVLFVTIVGYALWFWALGVAGAERIAPLQFGQPVVGVLLAILLFAEPLTAAIGFAACLTLVLPSYFLKSELQLQSGF